MSFPYWPNANGAYQQLNYISSTQALSIVPGGNTVFLNVSGGGGGGGQTINASTINVSSLNVGHDGISMGGPLNMNNNTIALNTPGTSAIYFNAGSSDTYIQGESGHTVAIGTQANPVNLQISDGSINVAAALYATSQQVLVSTLTVSTINGAPYPPQGSGAVSTIGFSAANFPAGNGSIPINNVPIAITDSFAVDTTHRYRITFEGAYTNNDGTGPTNTSIYMSGTSPTYYLMTIDNRQALASLNDLRMASSGVFVPSSSTAQLVGANTSAIDGTGCQFNTVAGVVLEDLGPI